MKKKEQKNSQGLSRRIHFADDEQRLPWLPALLDSYAVADTGVAVAVRREEKQRKRTLACANGCGNCCEHQKDLPVFPHEIVGIYWFVSEKAPSSARDILKSRLALHTSGSSCPFLIGHSCSIHPLRPVGCRQFNVFSAPCAMGEDPYYTRRDDVLVPLQEYTDRAFAAVLPLYDMKREGDLAAAIKLVRSQILNLQTFDWKRLADLLNKNAARQ